METLLLLSNGQFGTNVICQENKGLNGVFTEKEKQRKNKIKIYSWTQYEKSVNRCDWHILASNKGRIVAHCLTRFLF